MVWGNPGNTGPSASCETIINKLKQILVITTPVWSRATEAILDLLLAELL